VSVWRARRRDRRQEDEAPRAASTSPDSVLAGVVVAPWQTLVAPERLDMDRNLVAQIRAELARKGNLNLIKIQDD
jgi:hypothetical protein